MLERSMHLKVNLLFAHIKWTLCNRLWISFYVHINMVPPIFFSIEYLNTLYHLLFTLIAYILYTFTI